ncbi:MAG: pseudouridylate synthase [Deltaproteobacteria bacterium]|nr:MAG: pseudouridylate synthase [Deltaproteobacteria bacterium]
MSAAPDIEILHRDEALVVIAKPSGLAVHKGWAKADHYAMTATRDALGQWVYPVHRLDQATSGALLFALSPELAEALAAQFRAHTIEKRYLALVRGVPPEALLIDRPLARDKGAELLPARTSVRRLWIFERRYSLVEARPESGRQHQIRRHLKGATHPLIGDVRYGKGDHNRLFRDRFGLHRLALHAARLSFDHPVSGERLTVAAPVPEDLAGPLRAMGCPESALAP